jgi:thymidylate kinase
MFITFSGLDGSGKTTLIGSLKTALEQRNYRVTALTMYGQVSLYGIIRLVREWIIGGAEKTLPEKLEKHEILAGQNFSSDETIPYGRFQRLIANIFRGNAIKRCAFVFDLFILLVFRLYLERVKNHIFILDRYFYDFLADVADGRRWLYIRAFLSVTPTPDVPIFIDISPDEAFSRKGEYSVAHLERRHTIYMKIFQWVRNPVFIQNDDLEKTKGRIEKTVFDSLNSDKTNKSNQASE